MDRPTSDAIIAFDPATCDRVRPAGRHDAATPASTRAAYGTFVRVLGHYVRERGALDLPSGDPPDDRPAGRQSWG